MYTDLQLQYPFGRRAVPCGWMTRWTDMTKLIVTFSNTENTPNEEWKNLMLIFQV